jgi:hypothetical protein
MITFGGVAPAREGKQQRNRAKSASAGTRGAKSDFMKRGWISKEWRRMARRVKEIQRIITGVGGSSCVEVFFRILFTKTFYLFNGRHRKK